MELKTVSKTELDWYLGQGWRTIPTNIGPKDRPDWGMWECVRELVQNSLDETEAYKSFVKVVDGVSSLVVEDDGEGMLVKGLILGGREKPAWARGRFGEGLKYACLVALREGYDVSILTVGTEITPVLYSMPVYEPRLGKDIAVVVLWFLYRSYPQRTRGTTVVIKGYPGPDYSERFAVNRKPTFEFTFDVDGKPRPYQIFDDPVELVKKLYVRDIYVMDLKNALFSYNLWNIRLTRERNTPERVYDVFSDAGWLWAHCNQLKLIKRCLKALQISEVKGPWEQEISLSLPPKELRPLWQQAWGEVFGREAVIQTTEELGRRAEWYGYAPIVLAWSSSDVLKAFIATDREVTAKKQADEVIPDEELPSNKWTRLDFLRALTGIIISTYYPRKPQPWIRAAKMPGGDRGSCARDIIFINVEILDKVWESIEVLIHELAHYTSGAEDLTKPHLHEVSRIGSIVTMVITEKEDYRRELTTLSQ